MHDDTYHTWLRTVANSSVGCLLETGRCDPENQHSYLFHQPRALISCFRSRDIIPAMQQLTEALAAGYYVCGFISFEAASCFLPRLDPPRADSFPLLWMGVFRKPHMLRHPRPLGVSSDTATRIAGHGYHIVPGKYSVSAAAYLKTIKTIKKLIARGDTYQINYTFKRFFRFGGNPLALYLALRTTQPVSYQAFIKAPGFNILSFSPELFFRQDNSRILLRPMKGTAAPEAEAAGGPAALNLDPKNQAENLMIVDMLRNDLGRICRTGSIAVPQLFSVERYPTLLQMTSTITGQLQPGLNLYDIFAGLFPCGSVTGAPKIRTLQLIQQLESGPRRIYTGAIGFITPEHRSVFNVAIRTLLIRRGQAELGIGSGITYPSPAAAEYSECLLKERFLEQASFALIETMRWTSNGCPLLALHLQRLMASAQAFGFRCDRSFIKKKLAAELRPFPRGAEYKVRLLLFRNAAVSLDIQQLPPKDGVPGLAHVRFAGSAQHSGDLFLRHKTTRRRIYDTEYERTQREGYFDVLFRNERGEVTEGAISNIFLRRGRDWITPPLSCGVLPGVYRRYFIERHRRTVKEQIITDADLHSSDAIFCCNAVRGMVRVRLEL